MPDIDHVHVDRDVCIGSADCVYAAPDVFRLDEERKAVVDVGAAAETDPDLLWKAADSCPVLAISLYDKEGNALFPQF